MTLPNDPARCEDHFGLSLGSLRVLVRSSTGPRYSAWRRSDEFI